MKDFQNYCVECGEEYPIEIVGYSAGYDAVIHLLPENCYPGESSEVEYTATCPHCGYVDESDSLYDDILEYADDEARQDYWD